MNCNYNEFIEISEPYEVGSPFYGIEPSLTEFIKGLYLDGKNKNFLQYPFKHIQVLNCSNNFQFIFAKRGGSLVFLNYIPSNQKITFEDLIPYYLLEIIC